MVGGFRAEGCLGRGKQSCRARFFLGGKGGLTGGPNGWGVRETGEMDLPFNGETRAKSARGPPARCAQCAGRYPLQASWAAPYVLPQVPTPLGAHLVCLGALGDTNTPSGQLGCARYGAAFAISKSVWSDIVLQKWAASDIQIQNLRGGHFCQLFPLAVGKCFDPLVGPGKNLKPLPLRCCCPLNIWWPRMGR